MHYYRHNGRLIRSSKRIYHFSLEKGESVVSHPVEEGLLDVLLGVQLYLEYSNSKIQR
jgi:hypothetical protein